MAGVKWHGRQMLPYPKGCHRSWLRRLCESETRCKASVTEVWSCTTLHLNLTFLMSLFFKHDPLPAVLPHCQSLSPFSPSTTFPIFLLYPPQCCLLFPDHLPSYWSLKPICIFYTDYARRHSSLSYKPNAWMRKTHFPQLCEDKETGSTHSYTATAEDLAAFQQEPEPWYNVRNYYDLLWTPQLHHNTEKERQKKNRVRWVAHLLRLICASWADSWVTQ